MCNLPALQCTGASASRYSRQLLQNGSNNPRGDKITQSIGGVHEAILSAVEGQSTVREATLVGKDYAYKSTILSTQPADFSQQNVETVDFDSGGDYDGSSKRKLLQNASSRASNNAGNKITQSMGAVHEAILNAVEGRGSAADATSLGKQYAYKATVVSSQPGDFSQSGVEVVEFTAGGDYDGSSK